MRCISPILASQNDAGDIVYSSTKASRGLIGFQLECRRCLPCRLNLAREKAVRALHEAKMHEDNIFLTLTYDPENLKSKRLQYPDFQKFIKSLRERTHRDKKRSIKISDQLYMPYMVTGEYGEENKRPHWHAILFNYSPKDKKYLRTTKDKQTVYTSQEISQFWPHGFLEFGSVTFESAGYVARYAAKKLVHGRDQDHDYHPIHKTSSRRAIGRSWIEQYYQHTFDHGHIVLPNGQTSKIPRYYTDWLRKYHPATWETYVTGKQLEIIEKATNAERKKEIEFLSLAMSYKGGKKYPLKPYQVEEKILQSKFKRLQEELKL